MATIEELMTAQLLEVFAEHDPERRRAAIARTYTPGVQFFDPDDSLTGHDALHAKVQQILDGAPGLVFAADGPVRVNHDLGYLAWTLAPGWLREVRPTARNSRGKEAINSRPNASSRLITAACSSGQANRRALAAP